MIAIDDRFELDRGIVEEGQEMSGMGDGKELPRFARHDGFCKLNPWPATLNP